MRTFWIVFIIFWTSGPLSAEPPIPRYPDKNNLLLWKDDAGKPHPVKTADDWAKRRAHVLEGLQDIMGQLPSDKEKVPLDVRYGDEVRTPGYVRKKLTFAVDKGDRVPAWLLIPHDLKGKAPAVLCLHQTVAIGKDEPAGLGKSEELRYAHHLAERGYVTLAPDYPSFGEYPFDFAKSKFPSGSMKAIWNNMRAVDLLVSLPQVDAERLGVIGHSLGGHNGMFTAAFDTRLKAIVSNCGFTSFPKYYGGNLKGWTSARYVPRINSIHNNKPDRLPIDFPEIVAAFAPRAFLASSPVYDSNFEVSGVKDCLAAALPVYELHGVKEKLQANYPNCKHEFPTEVRQVAYDFLDRWLKGEGKSEGKLELTVRETAGIRRFGYPVYARLQLPRKVTAEDRFRLVADGKAVAAQFRPRAGEPMAVDLDFAVNAGPFENKSYQIEYGPGVTPVPEGKGLTVAQTPDSITVGSGSLAYVVGRDLDGLLGEVRDGKRIYVKPGSPGLQLGKTALRGDPKRQVRVIRQGPSAVELGLAWQEKHGEGKQLAVDVHLTFPRTKSWVEVDVEVASEGMAVPSLGAIVNLDVDSKPTLVDFGAGTAVYTTLREKEAASLTAHPKGAWEVRTGKVGNLLPFVLPASNAMAAEGWAHVMDRTRCTALAIDGFGKGGMERIQVSGEGELSLVRNFVSDEKATTHKKRLRFWLHFVGMPVQVGAVTSPQSMMAPLVVEWRRLD